MADTGQQTLNIQQALDLAVQHHSAGRLPEAEGVYQQILQADPNQPIALHLLGVIAHQVGKNDLAVDLISKALTTNPNYVAALNNIGLAFKDLGRLDEAVASFHKALSLAPDYVDAHHNLSLVLLDQGKLDDAIKHSYEVLKLDPKNIGGHVTLSNSLSRLVPDWHTPMMNDHLRNDAFQAALRSAVTEDTHVLEIGTGSGLLAMMAARCGAERITTCEGVPIIASTARKIIANNGMADVIKVVAKKSTELMVGEDLPRKADLLVSEILSSEFLTESVFESIEDAKRRLLSPEGKVIPGSGSIMIALFGGDRIGENVMVEDVCGFNLRDFNSITSKRRALSANDYGVELLTEDIEAFSFDFNKTDYFLPEQKIIKVPIRKAGRCYGIIQWIRMQMDDTIKFENHPSVKAAASGWKHMLYVFDEPTNVKPKQLAVVSAGHTRDVPWFGLESIEEA